MKTISDLQYTCVEVGRLASKNQGHYGNIVFPQQRNNKAIIREPELRDVFGRHLMLEMVYYGIEVPTKKKYSFSGSKSIVARTDVAIFPSLQSGLENNPIINIELKEGAPAINQLEKDWQKLLSEPVEGVCFYHILQNSDAGTLPNLIEKYEAAYNLALSKPQNNTIDKWFLFFIVVLQKQSYLVRTFESILVLDYNLIRNAKFISF